MELRYTRAFSSARVHRIPWRSRCQRQHVRRVELSSILREMPQTIWLKSKVEPDLPVALCTKIVHWSGNHIPLSSTKLRQIRSSCQQGVRIAESEKYASLLPRAANIYAEISLLSSPESIPGLEVDVES
jgi:hypothetical protein